MCPLCSIVYDAGTALESYEWLDVRSSSDAELRVLEEKVNVLDLPSPPGAQVGLPICCIQIRQFPRGSIQSACQWLNTICITGAFHDMVPISGVADV